MNKAKEISNGYKNLVKSKLGLSAKKDELIFMARRTICNSCEFRDPDWDICKKCGCPLTAKTKSLLTDCPEELW